MSDREDDNPNWDELIGIMREARVKSRGYASYWEWAPHRCVAEVGVAQALAKYLSHVEGRTWASVQAISDDPPDVLLLSSSGSRVGVEVTELLDAATVERHRHRKKSGSLSYDWALWTIDNLTPALVRLVERKDAKLAACKERYDEIIVAVATDEPMISLQLAQDALRSVSVRVRSIHRAFLLLSYHPAVDDEAFPGGIPVLSIPLERA